MILNPLDLDLSSGGVYLLHFSLPLHHAQHYIGWAKSYHTRFNNHSTVNGSSLVRHVLTTGRTVSVVRLWRGRSRSFERELKKRKYSPRICPFCSK